jgi:spore coat protein CotH
VPREAGPPPPEPEPAWVHLSHPFEEGGLSVYELRLRPEDWKELIDLPVFGRWYRGSLVWCGERFDDVGVRASGQITRVPGSAKPSLRISFSKFGKAGRFHGLSGFKLDNLCADPSMLRERLAYGCYREAGLPAPREVHSWVKVNGEDKGLYAVEERIGKRYVKRCCPGPITQLYSWTGVKDDFTWEGSYALNYVPIALKPRFRSLPFGGQDIAALADTIVNKPYEATARVFDVDILLRQLAVEILTGETDGLVGVPMPGQKQRDWMSNFFLYRDPGSGKYRTLVWDRDQSFWRPIGTPITQGLSGHQLTRRLVLEAPGNLDRLRRILRELLEGPLAPERLLSRLDKIRQEIRPAACRDARKKAGSNARFDAELDGLRAYIPAYAESLKRQLAESGH